MMDQHPGEENGSPDYLKHKIEEASKSLTMAKSFKANIPNDWDKDF